MKATRNIVSSPKLNLSAGLGVLMIGIGRNEYYPTASSDHRSLCGILLPSFSFLAPNQSWSLQYSTDIILPSIEQWRNQLITTNPVYLTAGNPDLKHSYVHLIEGEFNTRKGNNSLDCTADLSIIERTIANKSTYYTVATYLPRYDYTIEPQNTLTTYENMGATIRLDAKLNYSTRFQRIKTTLRIAPAFNYGVTPSFVNQNNCISYNYYPSLLVGLTNNTFKSVRLTLSGQSGIILANNTLGQSDRMLRNSLNVDLNSKFGKRIFINGRYGLTAYKNLAGTIPSQINQTLDVVVGTSFFKRRLELSISGVDLLNNTQLFSSSVRENYILNSWRSCYGRYFAINLAWKFYKSKSGLTSPVGALLETGKLQ
ncbi:MAG: outer membrane beta-barrel protein [Tidjanibacter sp.]|nr:outer membrane beta-barrel protein [Tidjanibacter sp.]